MAANLAAALTEMEKKVMLVGCDPKRDSTITLTGKYLKPLLEVLMEGGEVGEVIEEGYKGVLCIEIGGPEPGIGCAGRGLLLAFKKLKETGIFEKEIDFVIYDVPGDVVCGGFAVPMRRGFAREIYIVTSGEYLSLFAANNICKAIRRVGARLGGIVCNSREVEREIEIVRRFSRMVGGKLVGVIPRDKSIQICESKGMSVIECMPESGIAYVFREIAKSILDNQHLVKPKVLTLNELNTLML